MGGKRRGECNRQRERERIASCSLAGAVDWVFECERECFLSHRAKEKEKKKEGTLLLNLYFFSPFFF